MLRSYNAAEDQKTLALHDMFFLLCLRGQVRIVRGRGRIELELAGKKTKSV
jgi:hypothetical protein